MERSHCCAFAVVAVGVGPSWLLRLLSGVLLSCNGSSVALCVVQARGSATDAVAATVAFIKYGVDWLLEAAQLSAL